MGYDLHITRRRRWSEPGAGIAESEWLAVAEREPDLRQQLDWADGVISAKNPDPPLIDTMVRIARALDARVQGDDGEMYVSSDAPPIPYRPSLAERIAAMVARWRPRRPLDPAPLPGFGVGDTVTDLWHHSATVIALDPRAEHGLGTITVRYQDGREVTYMMRTHPFRPQPPGGS